MRAKLFALFGLIVLIASIILKIIQIYQALYPSNGAPIGVI
jgi:hypothetical protein